MRQLLYTLLSVILILDMCLLGMTLAQWQKTGDLSAIIQQNFNALFQFAEKCVIIR